MSEWNIALMIHCQAPLSNCQMSTCWIMINGYCYEYHYPHFTKFSYVFLTGNKPTHWKMQQDNLAATCWMSDDVMFAELALNVGYVMCSNFEYRKNLICSCLFSFIHGFFGGGGEWGFYFDRNKIHIIFVLQKSQRDVTHICDFVIWLMGCSLFTKDGCISWDAGILKYFIKRRLAESNKQVIFLSYPFNHLIIRIHLGTMRLILYINI